MSLDPEPIAVTLRVVADLERLGVEYLVGGSIASSVHGKPRTTQDVDIVARVGGRHVDALVAALQTDFYVDADMIRDAIKRRASFNVIHLPTMLKVDIFVFDGEDLSIEEMKRRVAVELRGKSVWFASAEDIVLQKLDWFRKGHGVSERQWRDALGVVAVQGQRFDWDYARHWATRIGVGDLLERLASEAT